MKHSCARLAPKHDVADAEAAEQWPRKEADEATGSLGRESKCPGRTVARGCARRWCLDVGEGRYGRGPQCRRNREARAEGYLTLTHLGTFAVFSTTVKSRGEIILTKDARINLRV